MSKNTNNFGRAMYDMFGVGKKPEDGREENQQVTVEQTENPSASMSPDTNVFVNVGPEVNVVQTYVPVPATFYEKSFMAEGTIFEGNITAKGDIEIAGEIRGNIVSEGRVTIRNSVDGNIDARDIAVIGTDISGNLTAKGIVEVDAGSAIIGNIKSSDALIGGKVAGDIFLENNLSLVEHAQIVGNIKLRSMEVSRGARITGKVDMRQRK